jgi:uncharacterized protein YkwD
MRRPLVIVGVVGLAALGAGVALAATADAATTTYEAESATNTLAGGARPADCSRCSGKSRIGWVGHDGVLTFNGVSAGRAGRATAAVSYTAPERRLAQLSVNGGPAMAINFPATRSVNRTATVNVTVTLQAGANTIAFGNPAGWAPDFDKLVVVADTEPAPTTVAPTATVAPPATAAPDPSPTDGSTPTPAASPSVTPPVTAPPSPSPSTSSSPSARPSPSTTPPTSGNAALEAAVVTLVNAERLKDGCNVPLASNDKLTVAARGHSADMAARDYFSHTTLEGVDFATRITNAGYRWRGAAENIAKGQRTPADVMDSWMNSAGHRANILNCGYQDIGVGVAADASGSLIWTQDFGTPAG